MICGWGLAILVPMIPIAVWFIFRNYDGPEVGGVKSRPSLETKPATGRLGDILRITAPARVGFDLDTLQTDKPKPVTNDWDGMGDIAGSRGAKKTEGW